MANSELKQQNEKRKEEPIDKFNFLRDFLILGVSLVTFKYETTFNKNMNLTSNLIDNVYLNLSIVFILPLITILLIFLMHKFVCSKFSLKKILLFFVFLNILAKNGQSLPKIGFVCNSALLLFVFFSQYFLLYNSNFQYILYILKS